MCQRRKFGTSPYQVDGKIRLGENSRHPCSPPVTRLCVSPSYVTRFDSQVAWKNCGFTNAAPRRWASSLVAEDIDMDMDSADDYEYEHDHDYNTDHPLDLESDVLVEEEAPESTRKKKKLTKRQKRKQSLEANISNNNKKALDVKFLHFASLEHDGNGDGNSEVLQELEADFDRLAFDHDLSTFKWISMLEKSLVLKLRQEHEVGSDDGSETPAVSESSNSKNSRAKRKNKASSTDKVKEYWKVALKAVNNTKKVPDDLKDHFLTRMVVGAKATSKLSANAKRNAHANAAHSDDEEDALLLARGRDLAVDHPLLWRRYSAKERKLRVRLSKKLMNEKAQEVESQESTLLSPCQLAILNAVQDRSTSLEYYLNHVRIPQLRRVHREGKTSQERHQEALQLQLLLKERLPESSYRKIIALVQTYVDCFGGELEDNNDGNGNRLVTLQGSPLTPTPMGMEAKNDNNNQQQQQEEEKNNIQQQEQQKKKRKQQKQFRVLLSNLRKALPQGRIHWISKEVADFFYVTTPDEVDAKNDQDGIVSDPVLGHSEANWKEVRDQYVQSFLNLSRLFLELENDVQQQKHQRKATQLEENATKDTLADLDHFLDPHDDPASEKSVLKTFDLVAALTRMDAKQTTTQRVKPRTYIPLEAMAIGDFWKNSSHLEMATFIESQAQQQQDGLQHPGESSTDSRSTIDNKTTINGAPAVVFDNFDNAFPLHPPVDRLVIVDNLPIDMTESRLREAYGRCGAIEQIAIFHSRPDLDPGRRATDSTKKIRNPSSSSRRQKWARPRTPLYAMILYQESASAQKASCDPLRLFGMVLDQHLMRSHRALDMKTLYLEDVPSSIHTVASMEFELNQLLQASDLYVCLDDNHSHNVSLQTKIGGLGNNNRKKQSKNNQLLSYTISFPSFEAAYWSYWKLSREFPLLGRTINPSSSYHLGGPALHWMETPRDSHLYWTRKLNF